jgi:hypothetical protein
MSNPFSAYLRVWLLLLAGSYAPFSEAQPMVVPPATTGGVICWQEGVKLHWQDFEASSYFMAANLLDVRVGACSAAEVAVLPCTDARGKSTFLVESFFVKQHSWVRDSVVMKNPVLLAHEQLHFDINELFARKVRRQVAQYYTAGRYMFGPELAREITRLLNEKTAFNMRFDDDTHRNPSPDSLHKWQVVVTQALQALAAYKSTTATCGQ